ncbi:hypothetical protein AGMMS49587_14610 [Spirochaetia bacterium]|nr:hypothetical protein AGMMS49587_14610 [Spirochaetia bacterium]
MMMKRYVSEWFLGALILLGLLFPAGGFAQTSRTGAGKPIPHVSVLRAEVRNNLIRLTWTDSPDAPGPVNIYRSNSPFTPDSAPGQHLQPVEVPYGVQSYIDETESSGWVYYFIAVTSAGLDSNGRLQSTVYNTVMPLSNTIAVNAHFDGSTIPAPAAPGTKPGISALRAVKDGEGGVTISYRVDDSARNTVLYRSAQPIQGAEDLLRAVIVQTGLTSPFVDYPVPGISYYYAVIFEDELSLGSVKIVPGANATQEAVEVSTQSGRVGLPGANVEIRSMPLPLMSFNYRVPGIDNFPESSSPKPLGPEVAKAISDIHAPEPKGAALKRPRAFSDDLSEEDSSLWEEYSLKAIIQGPFLAQDWRTAAAELRRYLSLPHNNLTIARARFYLGQSLYFSGDYQEALFEFLMFKTEFPAEAKDWIDAALAQFSKDE